LIVFGGGKTTQGKTGIQAQNQNSQNTLELKGERTRQVSGYSKDDLIYSYIVVTLQRSSTFSAAAFAVGFIF
jgi:hypothetical protein